MSDKETCLELLKVIEQNYYDSLPYFYKNLYQILLDFIYQFENSILQEDEL